MRYLTLLLVVAVLQLEATVAFVGRTNPIQSQLQDNARISRAIGSLNPSFSKRRSSSLNDMKRPFLDQVASTIFNLEMDRVESSSVVDEKGRVGEPMEWASNDSLANKFSEAVAGNDIGYKFKQWVADIVAGEYDEEQVEADVQEFIEKSNSRDVPLVMFSFTTCPFCRGAKDFLDQEGIKYVSMELDTLDGNKGNEVRAVLGKITRRTSVPSIFIRGEPIGGLNDGMPGLMPLAESGELRLRCEI